MKPILRRALLAAFGIILFVVSYSQAQLVGGRYEVRDAVSDSNLDKWGGTATVSSEGIELGEVTLLPGLRYSVGLVVRGVGVLTLRLEPHDGRETGAISLEFQIASGMNEYENATVFPENIEVPVTYAVRASSSGAELVLDELHITPPPSLVPNGGFEERYVPRQDTEMDPELEAHFSLTAPSWSIGKGELTAVLAVGKGVRGTTGLAIEGGPGSVELRSAQIAIDRELVPTELGMWAFAAEPATIRLALRMYPSGLRRVRQTVDGWTYIHVPLEDADAKTGWASIRIGVEKTGTQPVILDDVRLTPLAPSTPEVRVLVNQVGYAPRRTGGFVVASNYFSSPAGKPVTYALKSTEDGKTHASGTVSCAGRIHEGRVDDWGWFYWPGEFEVADASGTFVIEAELNGVAGESPPFKIGGDGVAEETFVPAVHFFWYQRCGMEIPGFHKACHLDDARLPDGSHVDGTGGWHDAGDYNKYFHTGGHTGSAAFALAYTAHEGGGVHVQADRDGDGISDVLDEALWGADFMARMLDPDSGAMRNSISTGYSFFGPPHLETDGWIGNDDDRPVHEGVCYQDLAIACWALLSMEAPDQAERFLACAWKHWKYALSQNAHGGRFALDALYLHQATGNATVLERLRAEVRGILNTRIQNGRWAGGLGDPQSGTPSTPVVGMGVPPAVLALFALKYPGDPLVPDIRTALESYLPFCEAIAGNPFGITEMVSGGDTRYFLPRTGWAVGGDSLYLSQAWAAYLAHRLVPDARWLKYADSQIDWILGKNPLNVSLMEGAGTVNLPAYHHRYFMIKDNPRGAVPGSVVNGITSRDAYHDLPYVDWDPFPLADFESNECWLPHNSYYILALSARVSAHAQ